MEEVLDCSSGGGGCNGGLMSSAFTYMEKAGGLCTAAAYPYVGGGGKCDAQNCPHKCRPAVHDVTPNAPAAMLEALAAQPVLLVVEADSSVFQLYVGGVLSSLDCGSNVNHAVLATAYNATAPIPFVRAQNSWGTGWGDKGYINIALSTEAGPGVCGIYVGPVYLTTQ